MFSAGTSGVETGPMENGLSAIQGGKAGGPASRRKAQSLRVFQDQNNDHFTLPD